MNSLNQGTFFPIKGSNPNQMNFVMATNPVLARFMKDVNNGLSGEALDEAIEEAMDFGLPEMMDQLFPKKS